MGGDGAEGGDATSLHVAAVECVTLQVSAQVVSPRQLHAIFVHTPTQPTLPAPGGLALLPLVESLSVAVGEVHSAGDHPLAALQLLQGGLHVPAARAQLKLLPELGDDHAGMCRVLRHAHKLGQGQLLPAVLLQGLSFEVGEAAVLGPVGLGRVGLLRHLRCGRLLMLTGFPFGLGLLAVALLAEADGGAVEQGVQRFLLALAGQAAESSGAALGVDAAGLPGGQGAGEAAAAARLLHQLAAQRRRRAQRQSFAVARFALNEGTQAPREPRAGAQQHQEPQQHRGGGMDAAGRGAGLPPAGAGDVCFPLGPSGRGKEKKEKENWRI